MVLVSLLLSPSQTHWVSVGPYIRLSSEEVGTIPEAPAEKGQKPPASTPWDSPDPPLACTPPGLRPLPGALCESLPIGAAAVSSPMTYSCVGLGELLSLSEPQVTHV